MKLKLVRNATIWLEYAGKTFLIDPMLGPKGSQKPFPGGPREDMNNPLTDLPEGTTIEELIQADTVILTHLHRDHFDKTAQERIPKDKLVLTQNVKDREKVVSKGFQNVHALAEDGTPLELDGMKIFRTDAQHSHGEMAEMSGPACGVVFQSEQEKTLYVTGDTVWYEGVAKAVNIYHPEVIAVSCGENLIYGYPALIMGKEDVNALQKAAPQATLIACHMEALNHWVLSRSELKEYAASQGFSSRMLVPEDGETIEI